MTDVIAIKKDITAEAKQMKIMNGQIKIGATVETPHGCGVIVKVERYKSFRRWAVLYDKSPFTFNPVWYHHGKLKLINAKN